MRVPVLDGYTTVPLTINGNEIWAAVRRAGASGDGLPATEASFGVWETSTNQCTNGGFESGVSGWTGVTRDTLRAKFGAASGRVSPGTAPASFAVTLSSAGAVACSAWIYIPSSYDGTQVQLSLSGFAGATGTLSANANMGIRDAWQRVVVAGATLAAGDLTGNIVVSDTGAPTTNIWIDGVQIERTPLPTPYIETNGAIASRSTAVVQVPQWNRFFHPNNFWIAQLWRMGWASNAGVNIPRPNMTGFLAVAPGPDFTRQIGWNWNHSFMPGAFVVGRGNGTLTSTAVSYSTLGVSWAAGDLLFTLCSFTPTLARFSVNGGPFVTGSNTRTDPAGLQDFLGLGSRFVGAPFEANSEMLFVAFGRGVPTDTDAKYLDSVARQRASVVKPADLPADCTFVWYPQSPTAIGRLR